MESAKHYNIAVIFPRWYSFLNEVMEGVLGIHSIRKHCRFRHFSTTDFNQPVVFPQGYQPDAILVSYDEGYFDAGWLEQFNVPIVNVFSSDSNKHPSVSIDTDSIAKIIVDHFTALGFDQIGFLRTQDQPFTQVIDATIKKECEGRNVPYWSVSIPDGIQTGEWSSLEELAPELKQHLLKSEGRTGIYANHDMRGRLLVDYCMDLGVSVPEKIGVLGRFDTINARLCTPELSSIVVPAKQIGREAILLMMKLLGENETDDLHPKVKVTELRVRESTVLGTDPDMVVLHARSVIRDSACSGLTVDELIQSLPLSRSAFEKRYRALMGVSPAQDIRKVRGKTARELLLTTKKTIEEVATEIGFTDARSFVVFFKREVGETPGGFRAKFAI